MVKRAGRAEGFAEAVITAFAPASGIQHIYIPLFTFSFVRPVDVFKQLFALLRNSNSNTAAETCLRERTDKETSAIQPHVFKARSFLETPLLPTDPDKARPLIIELLNTQCSRRTTRANPRIVDSIILSAQTDAPTMLP